MVERGEVTYEDKLAAEEVLSSVEVIPESMKGLLMRVADADVMGGPPQC